MLDERKLVLARICLRTLRVRRVHQADCRALHLHLSGILGQKVAALKVAVAITTQNHIRSSHCKHIALKLKAVKLLLLDSLSLLFTICHGKHLVHRSNQKACCSTRRV